MVRQLFFLDTEFTNFHDPELVSIGLVASSGEEFYAEIPFSITACSPFVKEAVIPLLGLDQVAFCTRDGLFIRLMDWLAVVKNDAEVVICFDSQHDETLFKQIFGGMPPAFMRFRNVGDRNINELLRYEFHTKHALPEHHALHDARAMRYPLRRAAAVSTR
ncbi:3'-5' exoribonuclease [Duganella sp. FT3S]|uniref:3'-5' exoribonuclease n=1 Tax=Rugamonas fusca TaxID=2758568 RepID=A0A7W2EFF6_9BURK|nr:3'-5' exoribonuclease [Rugamonas fusca]MBA5604948.1 3'-5' exoribonuclease [Rugamonas fusca]